MKTHKTTIFLLSVLPVCLLASCVSVQEPPAYARPNSKQKPQASSVANRFRESTADKPTVVQSAMQLSQKHAELSEEAAALRRRNEDLTFTNRRLEEQVTALEARLHQTQKELTEANDLLIAMRIELNNWKMDILGFRDEMRDAETAQLQALLKILKVLGGEVTVETAKSNKQADSPAVASLSKPKQSEQ